MRNSIISIKKSMNFLFNFIKTNGFSKKLSLDSVPFQVITFLNRAENFFEIIITVSNGLFFLN